MVVIMKENNPKLELYITEQKRDMHSPITNLWMDCACYVLSNNPKHAFKGCLGLLLSTGCWWNL